MKLVPSEPQHLEFVAAGTAKLVFLPSLIAVATEVQRFASCSFGLRSLASLFRVLAVQLAGLELHGIQAERLNILCSLWPYLVCYVPCYSVIVQGLAWFLCSWACGTALVECVPSAADSSWRWQRIYPSLAEVLGSSFKCGGMRVTFGWLWQLLAFAEASASVFH